jgi:hypothetical protein
MQHLHIKKHSIQGHGLGQDQNQNQMHTQAMSHSVDLLGQNLYQPYAIPGSGSYPQGQTTPVHPYHFHPYSNPRDCKLIFSDVSKEQLADE